MSLTSEKEALLHHLNQKAVQEHATAHEKAVQTGRQLPPAPVKLVAAEVEFPKWLDKGWKTSDKAKDCFEPAESKLAEDAETVADLLSKGWTEAPPKKETKAKVEPKAEK